jgi:protoporphyrinogen oxidase
VALTSKQRAKLPSSAFVYPKSRKYPVPTKAQARKAGISERERIKIHRAAKSYVARKSTSGTPSKVNAVVHKRGPLKPKRSKGRKR